MSAFQGIQRRFAVRGEVAGITIVDDFGHHPAEVRTTLAGARSAFPGRRIITAFQPHRYSRTRDQFQEFSRSFYDADQVILCDVFSAGEKPIEGATSQALAKAVEANGHKDVRYIARREDIATRLESELHRGDVVITLGAGNIQLTCNELIQALESTREPAKHKNLVTI